MMRRRKCVECGQWIQRTFGRIRRVHEACENRRYARLRRIKRRLEGKSTRNRTIGKRDEKGRFA